MDKLELAQTLLRLRESAGLSQSELGRRIGRPTSTVGRVEKAEMDAPIELVTAWAAACERRLFVLVPPVTSGAAALLSRIQARGDRHAGDSNLYHLSGLMDLLLSLPQDVQDAAFIEVMEFRERLEGLHYRELARKPAYFRNILNMAIDGLRGAMTTRRMSKGPGADAFVAESTALVAEVLALAPVQIHAGWTPEMIYEHFTMGVQARDEVKLLHPPPPRG